MVRMNPQQFEKFKAQLKPPQTVVQMGLMDDMTSKGTADTACQLSFEQAALSGKIIEVQIPTEIAGISKAKLYRVTP